MANLIDDFMSRYIREFDYYSEAARVCAEQCETGLERLGIRAIVTYRAKRPDRLKAKITLRMKEKNYRSVEDIYQDIQDLAGVRVALYFPGDRAEVSRFLESRFLVQSVKDFPEHDAIRPKNDGKQPRRFVGYSAVHYRIHLNDATLTEAQLRFAQATVEVQVASVLMHAWAEVEHDLVYKPFTGEVSQTEYDILDELNGLILSGEIALEMLQRAVKDRVGERAKKPFQNHYELAAYIYGAAHPADSTTADEPLLGRVDILYQFLHLAGLNRPEYLKKYLTDLDLGSERRPLSDQIADRILLGKTDQSEKYLGYYMEAVRLAGSRNPYNVFEESQERTAESALGYFMARWIKFDVVLQRVYTSTLRENTPRPRPPYVPFVDVARTLMDQETYQVVRRIRRIRNQTVHGVEPVSAEQLLSAGQKLEEIIAKIIDSCESQELALSLRRFISDLTPWPDQVDEGARMA